MYKNAVYRPIDLLASYSGITIVSPYCSLVFPWVTYVFHCTLVKPCRLPCCHLNCITYNSYCSTNTCGVLYIVSRPTYWWIRVSGRLVDVFTTSIVYHYRSTGATLATFNTHPDPMSLAVVIALDPRRKTVSSAIVAHPKWQKCCNWTCCMWYTILYWYESHYCMTSFFIPMQLLYTNPERPLYYKLVRQLYPSMDSPLYGVQYNGM